MAKSKGNILLSPLRSIRPSTIAIDIVERVKTLEVAIKKRSNTESKNKEDQWQ